MANDILPPRERVSAEEVIKGRADLPGYKKEFKIISDKKPTRQPYAEIAKARLEAVRAADKLKQTLRSESINEEDTFETVDTPTLPPVVGQKKIGKGIRGLWAKMFGGRE